MAEEQKLKDLLDTGVIQAVEYERRLRALRSVDNAENIAYSTIVCFFADGSEKYTAMTVSAMKTFLENTPLIRAGLLTHTDDVRDRVLSGIPQHFHDRIKHKRTSQTPHFANWNPTQYKLDIKFFAPEYKTIFWMDSDSIVVGDMTDFLLDFARSEDSLFFVPDHVMSQEDFCARWRKQRPLTIIPQACLMGFKANVIEDFVNTWKSVWEEWITPFPFARYEDPNPSFPGSAFCIEQYALAVAISYFPQLSIRTFAREYLVVAPIENKGQALILQTSISKSTEELVIRPLGVYDAPNIEHYSYLSGSSGSFNFSGFSGLLSYPGSLSISGGSFNFSGLNLSGGSFSLESFPISFGSFNISGFQGSFSGSLPFSFAGSSGISSGALFFDRFGGSVLHTYNQLYPLIHSMNLQDLPK